MPSSRVSWLCALCGALGALHASVFPAHASVVEGASLEELVQCADVIVEARVLGSATRVRAEHGRVQPYTFTRLVPLVVLHGSPGEEIVVMEPGGSTALGTSRVLGAPRYARGERVLAFLTATRSEPGAMRTCGLAQGKFTLEERAGMATARRDLHELAIVGERGDPLVARADEPLWELDELERTIRQIASGT